MYNSKKTNPHTTQICKFTMQMCHRWTIVPMFEKANLFHGINSYYYANVSANLQTYCCEQLLRGLIIAKPFSLKEIRLINRRYNDFKVPCNSTAEYNTQN